MTTTILPPFPIFSDRDGSPLDAGYIWIGVENLPPQTNPTTVYWDEALTQPAAQPIRTSGGYPVNNGTPAALYATGSYSILAQDSRGTRVYSSLSSAGISSQSNEQYLTGVSGTNTITATAAITPAAYVPGQVFRFVAAGANTGAVTLNVSGLGARSVTKNGTTSLIAGDIPAGALVEVVYDGTRFQLINASATRAASGANTDITSLNAPALGAATATTPSAGANGTGVATTAFVQIRAWVNLNGAGSGDLRRGSWNVGSVTDNGPGDYTINFATGMADTNYATVVTSTTNAGANAGFYGGIYPSGIYSTSQVQVAVHQSAVGFYDVPTVCVAVFR